MGERGGRAKEVGGREGVRGRSREGGGEVRGEGEGQSYTL